MVDQIKSVFNFPWKEVVQGLTAKPAYLLIFALTALFIVGGGIGTIITALQDDYRIFGGCIFLMCFALFVAYLTIRKVESSPEVIQKRDENKLLLELRSAHPKVATDLERLRVEVQNLLQKDMRTGDFRIGFRYKDPTEILPMIHRIVGLQGEVDRMANIMAAFIKLKVREEKLDFRKVVFPKTGNVIFTIKAAERLGLPYVGFRGKDYAIADDASLSVAENYFDGILNESDKVSIIDDITFRGDTIKETISHLQVAKAKTAAVFVLCAHKQHSDKLRSELHEEYGGIRFFPILEI